MPNLPAVCDNCGNVFPSGYELNNSIGVGFRGNKQICPRCGGLAEIQDGIYDAIGNQIFFRQAFDAIKEDNLSNEDLHKIEQVLRSTQKEKAVPNDIASGIEDAVPTATNLIKLLTSQPLANFAQIIGVLLTIIMFLQSCITRPVEVSQTTIDKLIVKDNQQVTLSTSNMASINKDSRQYSLPKGRLIHKKVGRNDPCPCGSGQKWKHCHGKMSIGQNQYSDSSQTSPKESGHVAP